MTSSSKRHHPSPDVAEVAKHDKAMAEAKQEQAELKASDAFRKQYPQHVNIVGGSVSSTGTGAAALAISLLGIAQVIMLWGIGDDLSSIAESLAIIAENSQK